MKKINPQVETFLGINNALNPCSPQYRQGMAYRALNSRIDESGIWNKAAALASTSMGTTTVSGIPVSINCIAHYKFEETSGTTLSNSRSDSYDATASSASMLSTGGKFGRCIDCDGQYYATIANHANLQFAGDEFSISAWVYVPSDFETFTFTKTLISKKQEWMVQLNYITHAFTFYFYDTAYVGFSQNGEPAIGWNLITVTSAGTGISGCRFYINGIISSMGAGSTVNFTNTANDIYIGRQEENPESEQWPDKIDSLTIWDKELDANEIWQLYNNGDGTDNLEEATCPHYKAVTIKDSKKVAKYLRYNTHLAVGPNRYGYIVSDDLGTGRKVYWWDGTDKDTAVAFVNNTTAFNYGLAGLVRPTMNPITEKNLVTNVTNTPSSEYGGRQEFGRYYYAYTYYDTERDVESLPSTVVDYTFASEWDWSSYYESCRYPVISIKSDTNTSPATGSGRYNTNTKIRLYRSKRTDTTKGIVNPPNILYFVQDMDYRVDVTGLTYDHAGGTPDRKLIGSNGTFEGVEVGDLLYLYGSAGAGITDRAYKVSALDETNAAYVQLQDAGGMADDTTISCCFMCQADYQHDKELINEYEGRGSCPPANVDCIAPFSNRMYYFVGNTVYWSSAGRPDEVAQSYALNFNLSTESGKTATSSMTMTPKLSIGGYGEAKYQISELSGETVLAAYPIRNRLYIWTAQGTCGYLEGTYSTEGIRFYLLRKGIGIISEKTLCHTPYGLFGADREGLWQMNNAGEIYRISKGVIDFGDSTKDTYALQSSLEHSFGVWSSELDEYIWCLSNIGSTTYCHQIAYNPLRRIFSGSYRYPAMYGGCEVVTDSGSQNYLTNGKTFNKNSNEELLQTFEFWMGQGSMDTVKENVGVEVVYNSITAAKDVTLALYQNNIASTTNAMSITGVIHNDDNLVGYVKPNGSGRMFMLSISIPADCVAPILAINYIAEFIPWNEKKLR